LLPQHSVQTPRTVALFLPQCGQIDSGPRRRRLDGGPGSLGWRGSGTANLLPDL